MQRAAYTCNGCFEHTGVIAYGSPADLARNYKVPARVEGCIGVENIVFL